MKNGTTSYPIWSSRKWSSHQEPKSDNCSGACFLWSNPRRIPILKCLSQFTNIRSPLPRFSQAFLKELRCCPRGQSKDVFSYTKISLLPLRPGALLRNSQTLNVDQDRKKCREKKPKTRSRYWRTPSSSGWPRPYLTGWKRSVRKATAVPSARSPVRSYPINPSNVFTKTSP